MQALPRWKHRFNSYKKALNQLNSAILLSKERELSLLEKQGLIQAFEFIHELAWNLLKDYLEYQGYQNIKGSRDAIREAFRVGLIEDGEAWMDTIKARNITLHVYDESMVEEIFEVIVEKYADLFNKLKETFEKIEREEDP